MRQKGESEGRVLSHHITWLMPSKHVALETKGCEQQTLSTMGAASKKASIDSLLNPLHDDHNPLLNPPHSALSASSPEYQLRAASWDLPLWQQSERASIRIAARGSVQPPDPSSRKRPSDPPLLPQPKRPKADRGFTAEKRSKALHIQNSTYSLTPPSLLSTVPVISPISYPSSIPTQAHNTSAFSSLLSSSSSSSSSSHLCRHR